MERLIAVRAANRRMFWCDVRPVASERAREDFDQTSDTRRCHCDRCGFEELFRVSESAVPLSAESDCDRSAAALYRLR